MFVDASAILTIETGHGSLTDRLRASRAPVTSGLAIFEAVLAICRKNRLPIEVAEAEVQHFLAEAGIATVPVSDTETHVALAAHARYGKGRGHPAQLNLGDCFAYACARSHDVPLLFVGNDFAQTDIRSAMT